MSPGSAYVVNMCVDDILQGSILGPFLYSMFVSPLFDVTPFFAFADDKQVIETDYNLDSLILNMERKMATWFRPHSKLLVEFEPNLLQTQMQKSIF